MTSYQRWSLLFVLLLSVTFIADKSWTVPEQAPLFEWGFKSFDQKHFEDTEKSWQKALQGDPQNPVLLYNLASVSLHLKKWGQALAYLRQLEIYFPQNFSLQPFFDFIRQETVSLDVKRSLEPTNRIETLVFSNMSLPEFLMLHFIYSALILILLTRLFRLRRRQRLSGEEPSSLSPAHWTFLALWGILTLQLFVQILWHSPQRGTLIATTATTVHSAPFDEAPSIGTLLEGSLLSIKEFSGDWVQVVHRDSNTGWIKRNRLLLHTAQGLR